jgi:hypothetical protein
MKVFSRKAFLAINAKIKDWNPYLRKFSQSKATTVRLAWSICDMNSANLVIHPKNADSFV